MFTLQALTIIFFILGLLCWEHFASAGFIAGAAVFEATAMAIKILREDRQRKASTEKE